MDQRAAIADEIELTAYDPAWPARFASEAALLRAALSDINIEGIVHFGSTAVPGLAAKPIIDILVKVADLAVARSTCPPALEPLGYVFWRDDPNPARLYFVKGLPPFGAKRTHHLHIVPPDSPMWGQVRFARHLAAHPETAAAYTALKADLAVRFRTDREAYTHGKTDFIKAVMAQIDLD